MPQLGVLVIKREQVWTGEIAQQLRVLATFADGLGLIPTTMEAHFFFLTPVPEDPAPSSGLCH